MRFIDFFSGIGGFRVGMERAGHKCVGFCEWDKYAAASYTSMHLITEEQRAYLATLPLKKRQKEIMKDEYRNGEWYADDIRNVRGADLPLAEVWCFGAPCQDFSIAGCREGLDGDRSSLVREVFRLVREVREEDRPEWLVYENVKGMFSSNRGFDYLAILLELDELGYDAEWQLFNSKDYGVPQNRERIYTVGHIRTKGRSKIFPIQGTDGENSVQFDLKTGVPVSFVDLTETEPQMTDTARCLKRRYDAGVTPYGRATNSGVVYKIGTSIGENTIHPVWYEKYNCYIAIRKLTPRECFRLQGFPDELFERAEFVNSDSQLYKQAGNAVTTNVVEVIARRLKEEEE